MFCGSRFKRGELGSPGRKRSTASIPSSDKTHGTAGKAILPLQGSRGHAWSVPYT